MKICNLGSLSLFATQVVLAIQLDLTSPDSIKNAASQAAYDMVKFYSGNRTGDVPGNLPKPPYYWWECGAMFGALIDYWHFTSDTSYNEIVTQGMLFQVGPKNNYMPPNQSQSLGNDDQAFWGMAALSAAEFNFPNPPSDQPQWLALAQAVFNTQVPRWDKETCGGGLRWQIFPLNNGYTYKNTISNGCFFNMGARLAMYTKNDTYAQWADTAWDWMNTIGLMDKDYKVYDGSDDLLNCTQLNHIQWSYNAGVMLLGAANMYNYTNGSDKWKTRVDGLLASITGTFFKNDIMYEIACETGGTCNTDQRSFKAYLSRWMAATTKMAPYTTDTIMSKLKASAQAATLQCSGGASGTVCGLRWTEGAAYDGQTGVGEQMSAMEVIQNNLIVGSSGPVTNKTGGTSVGDYNAGGENTDVLNPSVVVKTGDRVGAGILTTLILVGVVGGCGWALV